MSDHVCQVCKEAVPTGWMRSGDPNAWYMQNVAPNAASGGTMRPIHVRCASRAIDCPTCAGSGHVQDAQAVMSNWHNRALAAESALSLSRQEVEKMRRALEMTQFGFNHRRCPVCAGWNVGPHGETDRVHTTGCPVGAALSSLPSSERDGKKSGG